ncbi:MAG: S53 family peptidase, partial [bacterium]|nr:S53 family peptidase [bacterium]
MTRTSRGLVGIVATAALAFVALGGVPGPAMAADAPAPADPNAVVTFLVGLPVREKALEAAAQEVSTPGTTGFRRYSTVKQVARKFGATAQAESALTAAAQRLGLTARIDATRLFARVSGTVASWQTALGEPAQFRAAEPGSAQDADAPPFNLYAFLDSTGEQYAPLPAALKSTTTWFLPLFSQYVASLDVAGAVMSKQTRELIYPGLGDAVPPTNGGTPLGQTCQTGELAARTFTPFQLSQAYGLAPLQNAIAKGVQPRIAVLSLGGGFAQSDVDAAAACFGHMAPVVDVKTGLGIDTPIVSLSGESALDLQTVSWAAQNLKSLRFIQVVNSTPSFIEAYALALTAWPTPPDAITNSWGTCELAPEAGAGSLSTVESLLQYAALVGTSSFVASGDRGSSACQTTGGDPSDPRPTVQYPGSSPFITAVGGTQLNLGAENARIGESVWNDLQYGLSGNAVGTGGPSAVFDAPWYQRPITGSDVRSVPDIAAQAGAGPGTTIYFGGQAVGPTGGTSQASPLIATGFAMMSSQMRAEGYAPLGFVNPWLYRTARFHDGSIYDVTVGSNQYPLVYAESSLNAP